MLLEEEQRASEANLFANKEQKQEEKEKELKITPQKKNLRRITDHLMSWKKKSQLSTNMKN